MNIRNLTSGKIMVKAKSIIARVAAANLIPPILTQENSKKKKKKKWLNKKKNGIPYTWTLKRKTKTKLTKDQIRKIIHRNWLQWNKRLEWRGSKGSKKIINDIGFLFALNDLDLGKTATVKHANKLTDYTPFKER